MAENLKIGFIGAGQMATALAGGIASHRESSDQYNVFDPSLAAVERFSAAIAADSNGTVSAKTSAQAVVEDSGIVFLAVKPQYLESALDGVSFDSQPLVISIVGGADTYRLERLVGNKRIVRAMPNTPCLIGQAASGYAAGEGVSEADCQLVEQFFGSVGTVVPVAEELIDSVTGLSGSGVAYVYTFIEALIDGGVLVGLSRPVARELALQTVLGAAALVKETGKHPAELRDQVTSPGGTTIAALKVLEETGLRDATMSAVQAATERAKEL